MKCIFLAACILISVVSHAQFRYIDQATRWSIIIPDNWGVITPDAHGARLVPLSTEVANQEIVSDVIMVEISPRSGITTDSVAEKAAGELLTEKATVLNARYYTVSDVKISWTEAMEANDKENDSNYVVKYAMVGATKNYIITCSTSANRRKEAAPIFYTTISSFRPYQPPTEQYVIDIPDNTWYKTRAFDDSLLTSYTMYPKGQHADNYTSTINYMRMPGGNMPLELFGNMLEKRLASDNPKAKKTQLFKDTDKQMFTRQFEDKFSVIYLLKSTDYIYMISFSARKRKIAPAEIQQWTEILKNGNLVMQ